MKRFDRRRGFAGAALALVLLGSPMPARADLIIVPTFDSTITSDANAATIENTINQAIQVYRQNFADNVTVQITFAKMSSGLGMSSWPAFGVSYTAYRAALAADAKTTNDATALAHLPVQTNNPVNNNSNIFAKGPTLRAIGISAGSGSDGTISLNTSLMNLSRSGPQDPSKYDLMSVAMHEMNEVLGLGSGLNGLPQPLPEDLFRYDGSGNRSYTTSTSATSFFSINGTTQIDQFNQAGGGDFGDWVVHSPAQVQDFQGTPGAQPNLGTPELTALDVIGFDLVTLSTPEPGSLTFIGLAAMALLAKRGSRRLRTALFGKNEPGAGGELAAE